MIAGVAEAITAHTGHVDGARSEVEDAAELLANIGLVISNQDYPDAGAAVVAMPTGS